MKYSQLTIARADTGAVLPLATVTVFLSDGVTHAALFDSGGTGIGNPLTADSNGAIGFAAVNGTYILRAVLGAYSVPDIIWQVFDGIGFVSDLASTAAGKGAALVGAIQLGTGAVARTALGKLRDVVSVKDFGTVGDGTTDDTAAIQAAIDYCRTLPSLRANGVTDPGSPYFAKAATLYFPPGVYRTTASLWFGVDSGVTGWDASKIVENVIGYGAIIKGETTGKPVLDLTGAFGMKIEGLTVYGGGTATPNVGVLLARSGTLTTNPSAGAHRFTNVNVHGDFTIACVYNYASEINVFASCSLFQNSGLYTYFATNNNARHAITSTHCTIATSTQSAYADFFSNTALKQNTASTTPNGAVVWAESVDFGPKFSGGYIDSSDAVAMPNVVLCNASGLSGATSYNQSVSFSNVTFEYRASQDIVSVRAGHTVIDLTILGCSMSINSAGGKFHLNVDSTGVVKNLKAQHTDGGTLGDPFLIGGAGEVYGRDVGVFGLRSSVIGTSYQWLESGLTLDNTFRVLDLTTMGVPTTATFVAVKVYARTTAAADGNTLTLRASGVANAAQYFEITPTVSNIGVQFEGLVPVVAGKIDYKIPANFNVARILLREYHL